MLALDISGTFDNLNWAHVVKNATKSGINGCFIRALKEILIDRETEFDTSIRAVRRISKIGCPQDGKASPTIWLIAMNDLLIKLEKANIKSTAFADDLSIVLKAKSVNELKIKVE